MNRINRPRPGERYRHFKNKWYQIITVAVHSETGEELVIYQALYGDFRIYARPLSMFMSEVDKEKYPDAEQQYRFELAEETGQITETEQITEEALKPEEKPVTEAPENNGDKLLEFLDARTYNEKMELFYEMKKKIDDKMLNDMAVTLDVVIPEGDLAERIVSFEQCLKTLAKYECNRLR